MGIATLKVAAVKVKTSAGSCHHLPHHIRINGEPSSSSSGSASELNHSSSCVHVELVLISSNPILNLGIAIWVPHVFRGREKYS